MKTYEGEEREEQNIERVQKIRGEERDTHMAGKRREENRREQKREEETE